MSEHSAYITGIDAYGREIPPGPNDSICSACEGVIRDYDDLIYWDPKGDVFCEDCAPTCCACGRVLEEEGYCITADCPLIDDLWTAWFLLGALLAVSGGCNSCGQFLPLTTQEAYGMEGDFCAFCRGKRLETAVEDLRDRVLERLL